MISDTPEKYTLHSEIFYMAKSIQEKVAVDEGRIDTYDNEEEEGEEKRRRGRKRGRGR